MTHKLIIVIIIIFLKLPIHLYYHSIYTQTIFIIIIINVLIDPFIQAVTIIIILIHFIKTLKVRLGVLIAKHHQV